MLLWCISGTWNKDKWYNLLLTEKLQLNLYFYRTFHKITQNPHLNSSEVCVKSTSGTFYLKGSASTSTWSLCWSLMYSYHIFTQYLWRFRPPRIWPILTNIYPFFEFFSLVPIWQYKSYWPKILKCNFKAYIRPKLCAIYMAFRPIWD